MTKTVPPRILLVEDDALIAIDLETVLHDGGCRVTRSVSSLDEAIEAIGRESFDCALLDINLGGGDPVFAAADTLAGAGVPFVFLSGHSRNVVPDRHRSRPFLSKPYLGKALLDAVGKAMGGVRLGAQASPGSERSGPPLRNGIGGP